MKTTHSYNYARPVEHVVVPTLAQIINLFDKLRKSGKVFRVDFVKRTTGEARTMVCRFGVKKYLKGGQRSFDAGDKGLFTVYEFGKGYRSITIDNLLILKTGGIVYVFSTTLKPGTYRWNRDPYKAFPARTSPMYQVETA